MDNTQQPSGQAPVNLLWTGGRDSTLQKDFGQKTSAIAIFQTSNRVKQRLAGVSM